MYTALKLFRPFEGNCKAFVAPRENEFDTPALEEGCWKRWPWFSGDHRRGCQKQLSWRGAVSLMPGREVGMGTRGGEEGKNVPEEVEAPVDGARLLGPEVTGMVPKSEDHRRR